MAHLVYHTASKPVIADGQRRFKAAGFSVEYALNGGVAKSAVRVRFERAGIKPIVFDYSPYVGHYGVWVPTRYAKRASRILFGR
jgi:hypothetical protein